MNAARLPQTWIQKLQGILFNAYSDVTRLLHTVATGCPIELIKKIIIDASLFLLYIWVLIDVVA